MSNAVTRVEQPNESPATAIIAVIERAAANPDVDIDKMERLLAMQERILARNAEAAFNADLAQMQNELPVIDEAGAIRGRDGRVQSTFAKFEDINEAVKPILRQYGFAVSFRTAFEDGAVLVTGVLTHRQGHRETSSVRLPADASGNKNTVQGWGSSISYGKRYTMNALLNITSRGEDNDGQGSEPGAQQDESRPQTPRSTARPGGSLATDKQVKLIRAKLASAEISAEEACAQFGIESLTALPFDGVNDMLAWIGQRTHAN